jgi:cephalosporin-C deacetylase-like acetyl esterase
MSRNREMNFSPVNRREFLYSSGLLALGFTLAQPEFVTFAQAASDDSNYIPLNRFPRMLQEYFVDQVREIEKTSVRQKMGLKTKAQAEEYVQQVREKILESFGPFPEKTPLNPRTTGTVERDAYVIEKVIFESRPNFPVTANLYIPKGRSFPLPGIVGTCGHSANGKASEPYQAFSQGLAKQGYVVLIFDPIGQGERMQYVDENLKLRMGSGTREHIYAGNQQFLVGEFFGSWRAWDGIRALDYLLTREEVDPNQVGVTGNSGGGTMTTWLCGVEQRWHMAAPSCFVTTFLHNLENELPADTEQCPPRALALGLDHDDFLAALAPKPVIVLGKERDYFDVRGVNEAYRRLKHLYTLLEAEDQIGLFIGPTYHGYSQENREAMYRWFNGVTGISDMEKEPELTIEEDQTLWCTPNGQVAEFKPATVFSFTRNKSKALAEKRGKPRGEELKERVRQVLKMPQMETQTAPDYRILRPHGSREYPRQFAAVYVVETEPGIQALVYRLAEERIYSRPPQESKRAVLYVSHHSSDGELRKEQWLHELAEQEQNAAFFTVDTRGIGESKPNTCGTDYLDPYGSNYFYAIHSLMLDKPFVGQQTWDVLRVLDWLRDNGHEEVHLVAKGWGVLPATFAALFSDLVTQVTLKNALTSYSDIDESEEYNWHLSTLLPNVLAFFDLPDCYEELKSKKLNILDTWGANPEI